MRFTVNGERFGILPYSAGIIRFQHDLVGHSRIPFSSSNGMVEC